jgi:hypothetical protein
MQKHCYQVMKSNRRWFLCLVWKPMPPLKFKSCLPLSSLALWTGPFYSFLLLNLHHFQSPFMALSSLFILKSLILFYFSDSSGLIAQEKVLSRLCELLKRAVEATDTRWKLYQITQGIANISVNVQNQIALGINFLPPILSFFLYPFFKVLIIS